VREQRDCECSREQERKRGCNGSSLAAIPARELGVEFE